MVFLAWKPQHLQFSFPLCFRPSEKISLSYLFWGFFTSYSRVLNYICGCSDKLYTDESTQPFPLPPVFNIVLPEGQNIMVISYCIIKIALRKVILELSKCVHRFKPSLSLFHTYMRCSTPEHFQYFVAFNSFFKIIYRHQIKHVYTW